MGLRHLWMRSSQQHAVLRVRSEIEQAIRDFFYQRDFVLIDSPILTGSSVEGTSTLFETDYFGEKAYLSQSGQLYLEPAAAAFGKVYCFGPTFRAEKSKTRRHLTEFWMIEPEVAFLEFEGLCELAEDFIVSLLSRALDRCKEDLKRLERDTSKIEAVRKPFPRITYRQGIDKLRKKGFEVKFGDDLGADEETALASEADQPLIVTRFPTAIKSFYMQPDPEDPEVVLGLDMLAPEGYGEIIGGSQRIHDLALLERRLKEHKLPKEVLRVVSRRAALRDVPALRLRDGPRAFRHVGLRDPPPARGDPLPPDPQADLPVASLYFEALLLYNQIMKSTVSSKGQITVPKSVRIRYSLDPGTEVEFELREDGALLRKKRATRHPIWDAVGSLRGKFRWPKGIPHTVDAYIDYVRGGSYEELTGRKPRRRKK